MLEIWFNALARASSPYLKNMPKRLSILAALTGANWIHGFTISIPFHKLHDFY